MEKSFVWLALGVVGAGCIAGDEPVPVGQVQQSLGTVTWVTDPNNPAAEGTPPEVVFDAAASTTTVSYFDVTLRGFWTVPVSSPTSQNIAVPTWGVLDPSVLNVQTFPRAELELALGGHSSTVVITRTDTSAPITYDIQLEEALQASYPPGESSPVEAAIGGIRSTQVMLYPFEAFTEANCTSACDRLVVHWKGRYKVRHLFSSSFTYPVTRDRDRMAALRFANWQKARANFPLQPTYAGSVLLVVSGLSSTIPTLERRYKERGFETVTAQVTSTATCAEMQDLIRDYIQARSVSRDKYVILVGDDSQIPSCANPYANPAEPTTHADAFYGDPDGSPTKRVVHVGRLYVSGIVDLANFLGKLDAYERASGTQSYGRAIVAADGNDTGDDIDPFYGDIHYGANEAGVTSPLILFPYYSELLQARSYAHRPVFVEQYGQVGYGDATNASLSQAINDGAGVLSFSGHGGSSGWGSWSSIHDINGWGETFSHNEVGALTNSMYPVVFSVVCDTIERSATFVRALLHTPSKGAIGYFGADILVKFQFEQFFTMALYRALYDGELNRQGMVLDLAHSIGHPRGIVSPLHTFQKDHYGMRLIGDPTMRIRRGVPRPLLVLPTSPPPGATVLTVTVRTLSSGAPVEGALVSVYKAKNGIDEILANAYTGANGQANVALGAPTPGSAAVVAQDDDGNLARTTVTLTALNP